MSPNPKRYAPFSLLSTTAIVGIGLMSGQFVGTAAAQTTGGNGAGPQSLLPPNPSARVTTTTRPNGAAVITLDDKSGRRTRLYLDANSSFQRHGRRNLCMVTMEFESCPSNSSHNQATCNRVQRKACKFCSGRAYDRVKCELWLQQRRDCQNQCGRFRQRPRAQVTGVRDDLIVASTNLIEETLSDGSKNVTVYENGNREEIWNVPATSADPFGGPNWCVQDLQYISCNDPVYDQTKCDKVQSKLCKYCNDDADYNQTKCVTWLKIRSSCVSACDDQLLQITLDDPYATRE